MKALFIYSQLTGNSLFIKHLDYIKSFLLKRFSEVEIVETKNFNDLRSSVHRACVKFDYLIFAGGDGTVNRVVNYVMHEEKKPILGYIPAGTTNDFAKNFKISRSLNKALKTIVYGSPTYFDVCKANDVYFSYVLACGVFSGISYSAKRKYKKALGTLAYYLMAIKEAFSNELIEGTLRYENKSIQVRTPFLLILNGRNVGGFIVNGKNKINDGKFHIFITEEGVFNGLLHYAFFKVKTDVIVTNHFSFTFDNKHMNWCVDGDLAKLGNVEVYCLHNQLQILAPNNIANKFRKTK